MTATSHAIIGTVIAAKIGNPALAIPLAVLSHLAADAFPHWDSGTNEHKKGRRRVMYEAFVDVATGFALSYLLLRFLFPQTDLLYGFMIVLFAQSFDWITAPYYFFNIKTPPFTWSYKFSKLFDNQLDKPWGIIWQALAIVVIVGAAKIV